MPAPVNLIVFGASGGTGRQVVLEGLKRGHQVTAFIRSGSEAALSAFTTTGPGTLRLVVGDIFDPESVKAAMQGHDAALCALGSSSLTRTTVRSQGTENILRAAQACGVRRVLVVSAMGVGESWSTLSWFHKFFFATLLHSSRRDHEAQEAAVKASELAWTIFRPSGLTDGPVTGRYQLGPAVRGSTSRISRADVAHALLTELDANALVGQAVTITN